MESQSYLFKWQNFFLPRILIEKREGKISDLKQQLDKYFEKLLDRIYLISQNVQIYFCKFSSFYF